MNSSCGITKVQSYNQSIKELKCLTAKSISKQKYSRSTKTFNETIVTISHSYIPNKYITCYDKLSNQMINNQASN